MSEIELRCEPDTKCRGSFDLIYPFRERRKCHCGFERAFPSDVDKVLDADSSFRQRAEKLAQPHPASGDRLTEPRPYTTP